MEKNSPLISYTTSVETITVDQLGGFFVDWPNPPSPATHLAILQRSDHAVLALAASGRVVGFATAITDGVISAFVPHLEVLPEHQHQGIGSELMRRLLSLLSDFYAIDLICDPDLQPFYERFGLRSYTGMVYRNHARQAGT